MNRIFLLGLLALLPGMAAAGTKRPPLPDAPRLEAMAARFAPTPLAADVSRLSAGDRQALVRLIQASSLVNDLFMEQMWSGTRAELSRLEADRTPLGRARLHYFWINKGPWSELDGGEAFLPGVPERRPAGANFYPPDMTRKEFESWVARLPQAEQAQARGFYTVVRRNRKGSLELVPYSKEYAPLLSRAAALLESAAADTTSATLADFLRLRARALLSNDYYDSEIAWMDIDAPIDVTFGPYETYNDGLFGYKAAFESYVTIRDDAETAKLASFARHLQDVENHLPEDPAFRNPKLGALAPIRVVNEIFGAGDGNHGVQTAAFNLPNDDRVVAQKGAKRVMLKNVQQAKFDETLVPISRRVLSPEDQKYVDFESFFTHMLAHELSHGLGPHQITVAGRATNPRMELKELYSPIEEAKADVTGLFLLQYLMDHGELASGHDAARKLYTTYLASAFRTLRFGTGDAHARGQAMQINFLMDQGGYVANPDGTFSVNMGKIAGAVRLLDHDLLTIEATGDYAGARKMLDTLGVVRPALQKALAGLSGIPIDIEPRFVTADELLKAEAGH